MGNSVHLQGAEEVSRAGQNIRQAADEMMRAASSFESTSERLTRALDDFEQRITQRLQEASERLDRSGEAKS